MTKGPPLLLFFLCLLCQPTLSSQDPKVLTILKSKDILSLDPGRVRNVETLDVVSSIFEGLVHYDVGSLSPEPCLAERWESDPQGLRWVFFLRKGVYFHDGREVDSSAVLYTFQQRRPGGKMPTPQWASLQGYIASIKALVPTRVAIISNSALHEIYKADPRIFAIIIMNLARDIARAHGGDITVASTPREGATFTVRLPLEAGGPPGRPA